MKLRNDVAAAELILGLDDARIESILIKGPSIASWLYDEGESRPYGDVDLLVSPRQLDRAEAVATRLGFRHINMGDRLDKASGHRSWFREQDGVCVELHQSFTGVGVSDQDFWNALTKQTEPLPLGVLGATARVPGISARALLVGLHAARHGQGGTPLSDLQRSLKRLPENIWREAAALARCLNAEAAFAVGLSLVPEGEEVVRRLELTSGTSMETLILVSAPPPTAGGWELFARSPGVGGKLRFTLSKLGPPLSFMRVVDPLGRRGGPWLPLAYLVRPFRLARQAPRGFRAWRDMRQRSSAEDR